MSLLGKNWELKNKDITCSILEKLLQNRGLRTEEEIKNFLSPDLLGFHDPFLMKDMKRTVDRIKTAIEKQEKIIVFGDYDADGITATAILIDLLQELGAKASYRLPHRVIDGYGLNEKFIEEFGEIGVDLLITVDCGVACKKEIDAAKKKKIDVIITDHHTIPEDFPNAAYAVLHPKQTDCAYPDKDLTGAGIAFKLAQALIRTFYQENIEFREHQLLDLACLGTIADLGDLKGENRLIVKAGLESLQNTKRAGLKVLKEMAGIKDDAKLNTESVSFYLAPRLNAAGRVDTPYFALQLLLNNNGKAALFVKKLEELNRERQRMTRLAIDQVEKNIGPEIENQKVFIAYNKEWHTGILGLIAGRLTDKYGRPSLIMEDRGDNLIGSARSGESLCLMELLNNVKDLLEHFGGHKKAAGFSLKKENLEQFISAVQKYVNQKIDFQDVKPKLIIDCEISPFDLKLDTYCQIQTLAPFGSGNEEPAFLLKDIVVSDLKACGRENKHIRFITYCRPFKIVSFGFNWGEFIEKIPNSSRADLVCRLTENNWNGKREIQLHALDLRIK